MENTFPVPLLYDMGKIFRDTAAELVVKPIQHIAVLVQIRSLLQYGIFCGYILPFYKGKLHKQTNLFFRPLYLWTTNEKLSVLANNTQNIYYDTFG